MKRFLLVVVALVSVGCSSSSEWTEAEIASKKQGCTETLTEALSDNQAASAICGCWLDAVSAKYSPAQANGTPSTEVQADLDAMLNSCGDKNGVPNLQGIMRWFKGLLGSQSSASVLRSLADDQDGTHGLSGGLLESLKKVKRRPPSVAVVVTPAATKKSLVERIEIPEVYSRHADPLDPKKGGTVQVSFNLRFSNGTFEFEKFLSLEAKREGATKKVVLTSPDHPGLKVEIEFTDESFDQYSMKVTVDSESVEIRHVEVPYSFERPTSELAEDHPTSYALSRLDARLKTNQDKNSTDHIDIDFVDGKPAKFSVVSNSHLAIGTGKDLKIHMMGGWLTGQFGENKDGTIGTYSGFSGEDSTPDTRQFQMTAKFLEKAGKDGKQGVSVQFLGEGGKALGVTRDFIFKNPIK